MIRVVIADPHAILREGLRLVLQGMPTIEVVGEAGTPDEILLQVRSGGFDVLLIEVAHVCWDGLNLIRATRKEAPWASILVLTGHGDQKHAARLLSAGALGYLTKASATAELVRAIHSVAIGRPFIGEQVAEEIALEVAEHRSQADYFDLPAREKQVLLLLISGRSLTEIAHRLDISIKTVSTYKARILKRMGWSSLAEIYRYGIARGLTNQQGARCDMP